MTDTNTATLHVIAHLSWGDFLGLLVPLCTIAGLLAYIAGRMPRG